MKRWTKSNIAELQKLAAGQTPKELATHFDTDVPSVVAQLAELGFTANVRSDLSKDPAVKVLDKALGFLHKGKWDAASKQFEKALEATDEKQILDRIRQYLAICERQSNPAPEGDDPYLQAVFEKNVGNHDAALAICKKADPKDKDERFAFLAASIHALAGNEDDALTTLETAIQLEPKNRVHAYHDPDLKALREREEFQSLLASA